MTPEDEEFNRVEMESRIKQDYVRDMKQPSREQLMAEVTVLTELVRVLSDRVAELEKQEPVAWMYEYWDDHHDSATGGQWRKNMTRLPLDLSNCRNVEPLYTTPQQRTWVGLTDEEILKFQDIVPNTLGYDLIEFAKAIEAKLKEKNT